MLYPNNSTQFRCQWNIEKNKWSFDPKDLLIKKQQMVSIGFLGATGNVGTALAKAWIGKHKLFLGVRDPQGDKAKALVKELGANASAHTLEQTIVNSEVVVVALPWGDTLSTISQYANALKGKIILDATNPIATFLPKLTFTVGTTSSGGEEVQKAAPGAHVVKAFNTIGAQHMNHPTGFSETPDMFYAGNDAQAKKVVAGLIQDAGFVAVDTGSIESSRFLEPLAAVWMNNAVHQQNGPGFAFKLMKQNK